MDAHAGNADGSRPFVTGVEPEVGVVASAVFASSWEINLSAASGQEVSVLDDSGRPFLRISPDGVEGDYGAPVWFTSAVAPNAPGVVRLPDGVGTDSPPDWRPVSRATVWGWFDPRIRSQPGAVTPEMVRKAVPVRLQDFSIPLRVGDRQAQIKGYVEFEPPRGRYVHRLLSPEHPAPGVANRKSQESGPLIDILRRLWQTRGTPDFFRRVSPERGADRRTMVTRRPVRGLGRDECSPATPGARMKLSCGTRRSRAPVLTIRQMKR